MPEIRFGNVERRVKKAEEEIKRRSRAQTTEGKSGDTEVEEWETQRADRGAPNRGRNGQRARKGGRRSG
jgi:hypothetical protein